MPIPDMARRCYRTTDKYGFHNCKKRLLGGNPFWAVMALLHFQFVGVLDCGGKRKFYAYRRNHEPVGGAIARCAI